MPAVVGVMVCEPAAASEPLQLPEAVQPVAMGEDHVTVVELLAAMDDAANVSVGVPGVSASSAFCA